MPGNAVITFPMLKRAVEEVALTEAEIDAKLGKEFVYDALLEEGKICTKKAFYNSKTGLYPMSIGGENYTVLGNALAILTGITDKNESEYICEKIVSRVLSDCSLSMKCFEYDALLATDKVKWQGYILDEIRNDYRTMVERENTVWETSDGASAFDNAGSLCHGWSAIPIYYYTILKNN